jgi:hypothetical protein
MHKILTALLALCGASAFAISDYAAFQQFQNEYNLNYTYSQASLENGGHFNDALATTQYLGLEVERLFNNGIWGDVNAQMAIISGTNQGQGYGSGQNNPGQTGNALLNQNFDLGGLNAKVGYAFDLIHNHLLLTPYGLIGRNTNLAQSVVRSNFDANITKDAFLTGGVGARLAYRINRSIMVYADQDATYNWDQSGPEGGIMPQNVVSYDSEIGAKFRVAKKMLLGVAADYTNYNYMATPPLDGHMGVSVYRPINVWSGTASVGLTY